MTILIIVSIVYFLTLVLYRTNEIRKEDIIIDMYMKDLKANEDEIVNYIEHYEGYKIHSDIEKMGLTIDNLDEESMSKIVEKIEANEEKFDNMRNNKKHKNKAVIKYKLGSALLAVTRLLKIASMVFIFNLYTLIPVLVIMLTGALFWGMVASVIIMVIYSISFEKDVTKELIDNHGRDSIEDIYVQISIKIASIFEAIIMQGNMIIFIIINEML